jgi:anti-sigma factor RsiW
LLTCKEFLESLNDYLDDTAGPEIRRKIEAHVTECPNCFVIVDTTKKTLKVYKGMEPQVLPEEIHARLMEALQRKIAEQEKMKAAQGRAGHSPL